MKNTLADLNDHLFAALERINSEDLNPEDLKNELKRADSVAVLGEAIIHNADVQLKAIRKSMLPDNVQLEHKNEQ